MEKGEGRREKGEGRREKVEGSSESEQSLYHCAQDTYSTEFSCFFGNGTANTLQLRLIIHNFLQEHLTHMP